MYILKRERDGAGDSGPMLETYKCFKNDYGFWEPFRNEDGSLEKRTGEKPQIGDCVRVGSYIARTFTMQDYWTTTPVEEIISEKSLDHGNIEITFRTTNSIYTLSGHFK